MQAYSIVATAPALRAGAIDSEGGDSHACREKTAFYLREQMCQARMSKYYPKRFTKHNKVGLTWCMLGWWRRLLTNMTCQFNFSLDQSRNEWTRGDLTWLTRKLFRFQNPRPWVRSFSFCVKKTKTMFIKGGSSYRQDCILGLWSYFLDCWVCLEGPG